MTDATLAIIAQLNAYSAGITFIIGNLVVFGFSRSAWTVPADRDNDPLAAGVKALGQSIFWGVGAYTWRMGYWDILMPAVDPEDWAVWYRMTGGQAVNIFWNLCRMWAAYKALQALLYLLPDETRREWRWWNVAFFPPWKMTTCILRGFRRVRKSVIRR